ncbi:unnamed protein product [Effrenium voratum]|nr:unnamed protein product [Effrenium voratum]
MDDEGEAKSKEKAKKEKKEKKEKKAKEEDKKSRKEKKEADAGNLEVENSAVIDGLDGEPQLPAEEAVASSEPRGSELRGSELRGSEPRGSEPPGSEPRGSEPREEAVEPKKEKKAKKGKKEKSEDKASERGEERLSAEGRALPALPSEHVEATTPEAGGLPPPPAEVPAEEPPEESPDEPPAPVVLTETDLMPPLEDVHAFRTWDEGENRGGSAVAPLVEEAGVPGPIRLGGETDDVNIPERVSQSPKRFTLSGLESVRRCTRCDLLWDGVVASCPQCGSALGDHVLKVKELLSAAQRDFLHQAFKRYDVDGSGRLDGKELRMAVRELGWDTKQEVLDRWARIGGLQGLDLEQFESLVASGKLGKKTFKPTKGKASQASQDEKRQVMQLAAGANLQFTSAGRQGKRGALIPGQDRPTMPVLPVSAAPTFGEGESVFQELPAHRKAELTEAWAFWDADHSGFLEPGLPASLRVRAAEAP